jgi:hypothetical protein
MVTETRVCLIKDAFGGSHSKTPPQQCAASLLRPRGLIETWEVETGETPSKKGKGCDIGYALAASSREEADNVDTCTVTAPDAITTFAVSNPNYSLAEQSVFSGLTAHWVAPPS